MKATAYYMDNAQKLSKNYNESHPYTGTWSSETIIGMPKMLKTTTLRTGLVNANRSQ